MFVTIDFNEDYVKAAVAYNFGIEKKNVNLKDYSGNDILCSIQIYKEDEESEGKYIDFSDVADVRKGYIKMSEEKFVSVDSDGEKIPGTENYKTFLYNSEKLSDAEYMELLKTGKYIYDNRIIETTWEQASNVSTLSDKFKNEWDYNREEKEYE